VRLLIRLKSLKDCSYNLKYFHKLQGFIFGALRDTEYSILHDKKGYKFFCFSNIFPVGDMKSEDERNLLISSPDKLFIRFLEDRLSELADTDSPLNIGELQFKVINVSLIKPMLRKPFRLISATPIIIRIPERNYEKYGIPKNFRKKRYVYWRPQYSFEAFVKQLEENLIKKYNEFYKTNFEVERIFEMFKFIKPIVNHVIIDGREQILVGSIWEFMFSYLSKEQRKILEFGIDCGFGERNSLGFGFMNVVRMNVRSN
jgi:CRISPR-associated endoribonuclease Cas6